MVLPIPGKLDRTAVCWGVVTDLIQIRQLAAAKQDENLEFRRYLTSHHPVHDAFHRKRQANPGKVSSGMPTSVRELNRRPRTASTGSSRARHS